MKVQILLILNNFINLYCIISRFREGYLEEDNNINSDESNELIKQVKGYMMYIQAPICFIQYIVWFVSIWNGTKPHELYSTKRMWLKSILGLALFAMSLSAFLYSINHKFHTNQIVRLDMSYVFMFNTWIQLYIVINYILVGKSGWTIFNIDTGENL